MRILVIGAGGFIGRNLTVSLGAAGHRVVCGGRNAAALARLFPGRSTVTCDFTHDREDDWLPRLAGIDAVINAAGVIRGVNRNSFEQVHAVGPSALFDACAQAGVAKVIQISALGADDAAWSRFHRSKLQADDHLCRLAEQYGFRGWIVVRPAVVIGRGGHSAALFAALAAFPWPLRIGAGDWSVPVVAIDDFNNAIRRVVETDLPLPRRVDLVGPDVFDTDRLTLTLRDWLGLPHARFAPLPTPALWAAAWLGERLAPGILSRETLRMLKRGHSGTSLMLPDSLGWRPRALADALAAAPASDADRDQARLFFLKPALRIGLAVLWIATGIISAFIYPLANSVAMEAGLGLGGEPAVAAIYAGAALDFALGIALLCAYRPATTGALQIAVMIVFTILATIAAPDRWIDPLGPLTKNLAVLLATLVMVALEARR